jgi:hypothetical protein
VLVARDLAQGLRDGTVGPSSAPYVLLSCE